MDPRLIAFYLPQFHPIPENDRWWGKGFTEWTNVTRAKPNFPNHYQPHRPADFGYYDLRVPEVRQQQADLARQYGIYGFCYYYYWFNGRRLLERPLNEMLESGTPDFPFCVCWANENWSRRWDGSEHEILMAQEHSAESDRRFIQDLIPVLKDPRYIRVGGAPLILVYRAEILPDAPNTMAIWREEAAKAGVGDLHLVAVQSFAVRDPAVHGFDAAAEFPPHKIWAGDLTDALIPPPRQFSGRIMDYRAMVRNSLGLADVDYRLYRGAMVSWDNTPRRGLHGTTWVESPPENYEVWLRNLIVEARHRLPDGEQFIFVNAWNEWAEGAHLEPDEKYGHGYLLATHRALTLPPRSRDVLASLRKLTVCDAAAARRVADQLAAMFATLERSYRALVPATGPPAEPDGEGETASDAPPTDAGPAPDVDTLVARAAGFDTLDPDARQALVNDLAAAFAWYESRLLRRTRERGGPEPLAFSTPAWLEHEDLVPADIVARHGLPSEPAPAPVNGVHARRSEGWDGLWRRLFGSLGTKKTSTLARDE